MESLQEQLLKAGLVNKNKAKKVNKEKQKQANQARKGGAKIANETRSRVQQERAKKAENDRQLNLKRQKESNRKAIAAQLRQLIEANKVDRAKGEIRYSFVYKKKVKYIFVTESLKNQLTRGSLAMVTYVIDQQGRQFELVPISTAQKVAERDPGAVVQLDSQQQEDDAYAAYQVPDDLIW